MNSTIKDNRDKASQHDSVAPSGDATRPGGGNPKQADKDSKRRKEQRKESISEMRRRADPYKMFRLPLWTRQPAKTPCEIMGIEPLAKGANPVKKFRRLDAIIKRNTRAFVLVQRALLQIRAERLAETGYNDYHEYCLEGDLYGGRTSNLFHAQALELSDGLLPDDVPSQVAALPLLRLVEEALEDDISDLEKTLEGIRGNIEDIEKLKDDGEEVTE